MMKFRRAPTDQDTPFLAKVGERVRARLEADPSAYRLPVDGIELYGVADFFSAEECTRLIALVDAVARPSPTYHGNADSGRTSYTGDVDSSDPFIRMIERRIDDFLGIDPDFGEVVQGQRYEPGQQFRAHFDYFDTSAAYWPTEVKRGGQRSWTAMGFSVPPQKGALLVWNNMGPGGKPNPLALHAGMPVERGTKYIVTKWYRARPWF